MHNISASSSHFFGVNAVLWIQERQKFVIFIFIMIAPAYARGHTHTNTHTDRYPFQPYIVCHSIKCSIYSQPLRLLYSTVYPTFYLITFRLVWWPMKWTVSTFLMSTLNFFHCPLLLSCFFFSGCLLRIFMLVAWWMRSNEEKPCNARAQIQLWEYFTLFIIDTN